MPHLQSPLNESHPTKTDVIVDNRDIRVGEFLLDNIKPGSNLSIVSAYFTIYAYKAMQDVLDNSGPVRFLYGDPTAVSAPDPSDSNVKSFKLNEDSGMELKQALIQKPLAGACAEWIRKKVEIRKIKKANFLHGKLYHVAQEGKSAALTGSSNFTVRGLGFGDTPNIELNLDVQGEPDRNALLDWFESLWGDEKLTADAQEDVLAALDRLSQPYAPEFVYYKTLFHVFEKWLQRHAELNELIQDTHLHDTEIWKALYAFQRDGATSAINRLLRHNGCIIADSVGLGKTWTALAVIKFFELRNERVLVLCPKRLENNWARYTAHAASRNNPFDKDRLNYIVMAHTDLSRYEGRAGGVDLAQFNWSGFDLIVIDESHNFRNEGKDRKDEDGNVIRHSRYNRLVEEVLKDGVHTKVLMLSATPVNTALRDLRNQIYLITEKREDSFQKALGIDNLQSMFATAQREFQKWQEEQEEHNSNKKLDKSLLLENLGANFLSLLDAVTLARSREHIRRFYPEVANKIGGFPIRTKPWNLHPGSDSKGVLSYEDLHERIGNFQLSLYKPSQYLIDTSSLEEEKKKFQFDQSDREQNLIGMMRINLLKRLESSVYAFTLTMSRILKKMDDIDQLIEKWRKHGKTGKFDNQLYEEDEDDEFLIGKRLQYRLDELNVDQWQNDLSDDRKVFEEVHDLAEQVTVERDAKLQELKRVLREKVNNAPIDKDGRANRKALIFTTFADTALYLYDQLEEWVKKELKVEIALVTGTDQNNSSVGISNYDRILTKFAPMGQLNHQTNEIKEANGEIDILIATDCISEGQNLQDCDFVVNYDIHWNPVRLMQRFGRIDRLGSRNRQITMVNFWPTPDLECYLKLENRVEARMALADATATGHDDLLNTEDNNKKLFQSEITFRDKQLIGMRDEILDIEETEIGIGLNDLTLDDFIAELLHYIQQNRVALESAPLGIHAIVDDNININSKGSADFVQPGAIFCLKRNEDTSKRTPNRLWPYFLVYVRSDGSVLCNFKQAQKCLTLFRKLTTGQSKAESFLENLFDKKTKQGQCMEEYDKLLASALSDISNTFRTAELKSLSNDRSAVLTKKRPTPDHSRDFTLITWLVIEERI